MSFPRTLDEIPSEELAKELIRRNNLRHFNKCPYCEKKLTEIGGKTMCSCRFADTEAYHPNNVLSRLQYPKYD